MDYSRPMLQPLLERLREPRRFIQVLLGPRQTGKTTMARQAVGRLDLPVHFASADEPATKGGRWIAQQWEAARLLCRSAQPPAPALLVLDEVQKITDWSESVKRLWDEDTAAGLPLRVLLLGSSPLLLGRGLGESLAGRFETMRATHWLFPEMRDAFGWDLEHYIYFGGYPGAASLIGDEERWRRYILDSLVETTLARDVLLNTQVHKPILLRRLFELACLYSGRELSYTKMLGQLQDAGNTTTLAGYLDLLDGAGMVTGLQKYAGEQVRRRASSPKLQVYNTALMSAHAAQGFNQARADRSWWGRLVESAVGAHLLALLAGRSQTLGYWRHRNLEVDFVVGRSGHSPVAIEVKSSAADSALPGIDAFDAAFGPSRSLLVGGDGIRLERFFESGPELLER